MTKKKSFLSLVLAIVFIIPCMFFMTACGDEKPVEYVGKTYMINSTSDVEYTWVSESKKQEYFAAMKVLSEEEAKEGIMGAVKITFVSQEIVSFILEGETDNVFYAISETGTLSFYSSAEKLQANQPLTEDYFSSEFKFNDNKTEIVMSTMPSFYGSVRLKLQVQL